MQRFEFLLSVIMFVMGALATGSMNGTSQLVSVVLVFRHGDRVIVDPYPNDPYKNESFWPVGWGQLTNKGKWQQYELGQWLRKRYKDLLPQDYSEEDIYVRSTDVDRTLMSAEANLAGLYPPANKQMWDKDIPWQPIPVHTKPEKQDVTLAMKKPCPRYDVLFKTLMQSPEFVQMNRKNRDLFEYVARNTGMNVSDFEKLEYIYNTLFIENENNFTLPEWTRGIFPEKLKPLADFSFAVPCYTQAMARLKTGPFYHQLLDHFLNITTGLKHKQNNNNRKVLMFSGHDTTIANLLRALDLFEYHSPPYTSMILYELRHLNEEYFVNVLYKNTSEPRGMVLKGCDFDCPMEIFVKCLDPIRLDVNQWERECRMTLTSYLEGADTSELILAAGMLFFSAVLLGIIMRIIYMKYKRTDMVYLRLPDDENV